MSVDDSDLRRADQVLRQFLRVVGTTDEEIRAAALAIAKAGGAPTPEQALELQYRTGETGLDRPWLWLVEVGHEAYRQGDQDLVSQVSLFVWFWMTAIHPNLGAADMLDMQIGGPPQATLAELYSTAIRTLLFMDMDKVIASNPTGTVHVRDLLLGCAIEARSLKTYLEPDVISTVNSIENKYLS